MSISDVLKTLPFRFPNVTCRSSNRQHFMARTRVARHTEDGTKRKEKASEKKNFRVCAGDIVQVITTLQHQSGK